MPFGRVVILVLPDSTKSGNGGGRVTPARGNSRGVEDFELFPVSHPKRPLEEDGLVSTAAALENLTGTLPDEWPYRYFNIEA